MENGREAGARREFAHLPETSAEERDSADAGTAAKTAGSRAPRQLPGSPGLPPARESAQTGCCIGPSCRWKGQAGIGQLHGRTSSAGQAQKNSQHVCSGSGDHALAAANGAPHLVARRCCCRGTCQDSQKVLHCFVVGRWKAGCSRQSRSSSGVTLCAALNEQSLPSLPALLRHAPTGAGSAALCTRTVPRQRAGWAGRGCHDWARPARRCSSADSSSALSDVRY